MEGVPWKNLFRYGITVLAALILLLMPSTTEQVEASNLQNVELIQSPQETGFSSENLTVVVSGNTSLPNPATELVIESANYTEEDRTLEVELGSVDTSGNSTLVPTVVQEPVRYVLKADFSREMPETVIVEGVFKKTKAFSPD